MRTGMGKVLAASLAFALAAAGAASAQDKTVPKSLVKFVEQTLTQIGQDVQLVAFVEKDNAAPQAVDKLKALDAKWQKNDGMDAFVKTLMANSTSTRLGKLISSYKFLPEAFIMNAQGTIVGETNQTSTYWKGEQEKFTAAYNGGKGAIWYGSLAYDESTKTNGVQVSVPVVKNGKALGAICFTVNVDEWEKR